MTLIADRSTSMWRLLVLGLPTCFALDWWGMVRLMRESRTEETIPLSTLLYTRDNLFVPDLMTEVIPETILGFRTELDSGARSPPLDPVAQYDYNNFWGPGNTNSPAKVKTVIITTEITGTPTIKTSTSLGTLRTR